MSEYYVTYKAESAPASDDEDDEDGGEENPEEEMPAERDPEVDISVPGSQLDKTSAETVAARPSGSVAEPRGSTALDKTVAACPVESVAQPRGSAAASGKR